MKIIGFNASPRKSGNTAWAIGQILEGAAEAGAGTRMFNSGELNINPCKGCLGCVKGDGCVVADDMRPIYAELKESDALVFGSPLYMAQMSGQAKVFTDRLFAQITPRFSPRFKEENAGKKLILVFTQGNPDQSKFQAYYDYTKSMFQMLEFDVQDFIVATGTRSGQASDNIELRDLLRESGRKLALGSTQLAVN
ncbi:MAG: flavodoxin family protein [Oscillospiraceae bacterium]|jgi:multimeric flavodoxin WrbA|nr:flavodoxin family protein [Oscillospiraceae bacterium]